MAISISFSRTAVGWYNIGTQAGTAYNVRGELFRYITGVDKRAVMGTVIISTADWAALREDVWTRRLNTEGAQAI